jgi:tetratricopeptide (TPR) repeat protein
MCTILAFSQGGKNQLYSSTFEAQVFEEIQLTGKANAENLLFAMDYDLNRIESNTRKYDRLVKELKASGLQKKKTKKKIAEIQKVVASRFLKAFKTDANYSDIITLGYFNSANTTILYAKLFDEFNVDYEILELPSHVYIVADPSNNNVTLNVIDEITKADERVMREVVKYLYDKGVISKYELDNKSIQTLYDQYFNKAKSITFYELLGLLYYYRGITQFNENEYGKASNNFRKALMVYPNMPSNYMLYISLKNQMVIQQSDGTISANTLATFLNANKYNEVAMKEGIEVFKYYSQETGIMNPNMNKYKEFFDEFSTLLDEELDLDQFSQVYYRILAYNSSMDNNYDEALEMLNYAYVSNPNNIQTKELIMHVCQKHMVTNRQLKQGIDSLEKYFDIFPFLMKNEHFQSYYTYCILNTANDFFRFDKIKEGEAYLNKFEQVMKTHNDFALYDKMVEETYANASACYVRKDQYGKAIHSLNKALHYVPESMLIDERLDNIKEFQQNVIPIKTEVPTITLSREDQFKLDIETNLENCWTVHRVSDKENKDVHSFKNLEFRFKPGKKVEYEIGDKTEKGKWAVRYKARIIYLIPERDKDNYTMFKVETITKSDLIVREFENRRMTPYRISMKRCHE